MAYVGLNLEPIWHQLHQLQLPTHVPSRVLKRCVLILLRYFQQKIVHLMRFSVLALTIKRQMPGVKLSQMILCVLVRATCSRVDKNQLNYYSFVSKGVNFNARVDNQWPASCSSAFDSVTYVANLVVQ